MHAQAGVDPAYEQRGADMAAARLVRDQHMEALKLHYQVGQGRRVGVCGERGGRGGKVPLPGGQVGAGVVSAGCSLALWGR